MGGRQAGVIRADSTRVAAALLAVFLAGGFRSAAAADAADTAAAAPPPAPATAAAAPPTSPAPTSAAEERELVRSVLRDVGRIVGPHGIDEGRYVTLGGFPQWIAIRGQDRRAPILLFLHGGPGDPISSIAYTYQRPWEDYYTVVNWDQRGFGRSAGTPEQATALVASLSRERYVADAIELIEQLTHDFGQRKVVLVGQSWGTVLALEVAHRRPDLLHAVVTQGLAVTWLGSVALVRERLIEHADRAGDAVEARRLRDLGPLPPATDAAALFAWARAFGRPIPDPHTWHNIGPPPDGWTRRLETLKSISPDSSAELYEDHVRSMSADPGAAMARYQAAMKAALAWDAERDVGTRFAVPVIVMMGSHDWQTSTELARAYYDKLCAPYKRWVEFPEAAHALNIEQPGRSVVALVEDVLPAVHGRKPPGAQTCAARPH